MRTTLKMMTTSKLKTPGKIRMNTSLAAPGALAHRLQRHTACNATPPATPYRLQRSTACNAALPHCRTACKKAARGPQNGQLSLEKYLPLDFWVF